MLQSRSNCHYLSVLRLTDVLCYFSLITMLGIAISILIPVNHNCLQVSEYNLMYLLELVDVDWSVDVYNA